jgi:hypothetical protein
VATVIYLSHVYRPTRSRPVVSINITLLQVQVFWVVTSCGVVRYQPELSCHNTTWRHSPEGLDFKHHRRESLKIRNITVLLLTCPSTQPSITPRCIHCIIKQNAMKMNCGTGGTRRRWVVWFTPQPLYPQGNRCRYPLDWRLGGPQSRFWWGGEDKNPYLRRE